MRYVLSLFLGGTTKHIESLTIGSLIERERGGRRRRRRKKKEKEKERERKRKKGGGWEGGRAGFGDEAK